MIMRKTITCKSCGEYKETHGHGLCRKCYNKQYGKQNRAELNRKAKIYQEDNRDEINLRGRKRYAANSETFRQKNRLYHAEHRDELNQKNRLYYDAHRDKINMARGEKRHNEGETSMAENRECSLFLGVHVAEQVLSKVFKNVVRMPNGNAGYDFICNKGKKIDAKSSCTHVSGSDWTFSIRKNKIADMFLLLTFNNRDDLKPLHIWLIPADVINHRQNIGISESNLPKWDKYKLDINKVTACCDVMKQTNQEKVA